MPHYQIPQSSDRYLNRPHLLDKAPRTARDPVYTQLANNLAALRKDLQVPLGIPTYVQEKPATSDEGSLDKDVFGRLEWQPDADPTDPENDAGDFLSKPINDNDPSRPNGGMFALAV